MRRAGGRGGVIGLLAVALLFLLAACGSADVANPPAAAPTATTGTQSMDMPAMTDTPATPTTDNGAAAAPTPAATAGTSSAGTEVQATLKEWAIELSQAEVPAGTVRFTVTNVGMMPHNLTITQNGATLGATSTFGPAAGPQTLEVTLQPGTYTLLCSLPGHAQRGQKIDLVVK